MDWWTLFFHVRRIIYAVIALTSFLWAIISAVYVAKEWHHFSIFQRVLVLAVIGIRAFVSILLYLMIIVVFVLGLDLGRAIFLLVLHAGVSVMFTLYAHNFSCTIFASAQQCQSVNMTFIVASWAITGLIYLLLMIPVPRPRPKLSPNYLLDTSHESRPSSIASVSSTTKLLKANTEASDYSSAESAISSSTVKLEWELPVGYSGQPYGATNFQSANSTFPTLRSQNPVVHVPSRTSTMPPSLRNGFSQGVEQRRTNTTYNPPRPLYLPNAFSEPTVRRESPDSVHSNMSASSRQPVYQAGYYPLIPPPGQTAQGYTPYSAMPAYNISRNPSPMSARSISTSVYTMPRRAETYPMPVLRSAYATLPVPATPHSIHSMAPSMYSAEPPMQSLQAYPQPVYMRGGTEPGYRTDTANYETSPVADPLQWKRLVLDAATAAPP